MGGRNTRLVRVRRVAPLAGRRRSGTRRGLPRTRRRVAPRVGDRLGLGLTAALALEREVAGHRRVRCVEIDLGFGRTAKPPMTPTNLDVPVDGRVRAAVAS